MIIVLIGPSGCGKGTQARLLSQKLQLPTLSSGELLRTLYAQDDAKGLEAASYWKEGNWVPDDLMNTILFSELDKEKYSQGFILDAYPRTLQEAQELDKHLQSKNLNIDYVMHYDLSIEESVRRIKIRREEDKKAKGQSRADEGDEAIIHRIQNYKDNIFQILGYYAENKVLLHVNAEQSIEKIFADELQLLHIP